MRCQRTELLPARTRSASPPHTPRAAALPSQPWLPQHRNSKVSWKGTRRRSSGVPSRAGYPAAGIRAAPLVVVTFQVGGERPSREGSAEVLSDTSHHSQGIPGTSPPTQLQAFPVNPWKERYVSG